MVRISRWQVVIVVGIFVLGILYAFPNVLSRSASEALPSWLPSNQQMNLGLDLQGGCYLLTSVSIDEVFAEQRENMVAAVRSELRQERLGYTNLGVDDAGDVVFTLRDPGSAQRVRDGLRDLIGLDWLLSIDSDGESSLSQTDQAIRQSEETVMLQTVEIMRRRLDPEGTRGVVVQRQGEDRVVIQIPGAQDCEAEKSLIGQTAKLTFHLVNTDVAPGTGAVPPGFQVVPSADQDDPMSAPAYVIERRVRLSGERLTDAQQSFDQISGLPIVTFAFDTRGGQIFADLTRQNVNRPFAIVLDDEVISAPVIRSPILGGRGQIEGGFTIEEAQRLALLLRAGALPASITFLEERSVGASLGQDSIEAGEFASILGLALVVVFMVTIYGLFGVMACVALLFNLILVAAALTGLQATLTLPGIAGIVLTIGMAVDANVLIFERIRQEIRNGRGPVSAIDAGYKQALSTIIDANLTTFIAAALLYFFGSGPIKGFAVTLSIGLITSLFSALMVTRLLMVLWLRQKRPQSLPV